MTETKDLSGLSERSKAKIDEANQEIREVKSLNAQPVETGLAISVVLLKWIFKTLLEINDKLAQKGL